MDDDETVLEALGGILGAHEFEVETAPSVLEALRLITTESFDVLLTDLHMPGPGDGLILVGAMRHANPKAVTIVLSANPDMGRASTALLREADEVLLKPVKAGPIIQAIRQRLEQTERTPRVQDVESVAAMLGRESAFIQQTWLAKIRESSSFAAVRLTDKERAEHLGESLHEVLYRLRYPQPLGVMTLFSMASMQHGAQRRRQGLPSPVLVEEARALQAAIFQAVLRNMDRIDLGQLAPALTAIADEINAQLLQSLAGYENEKPVPFTDEVHR